MAILIGPRSISAGDSEARRLAFHPHARIFGKAAAGGSTCISYCELHAVPLNGSSPPLVDQECMIEQR